MIRTSFDPEIVRKRVRNVPIFANFTDNELTALLDKANIYSYRSGETVFMDDDHGPQMYIILKGRVKVVEFTSDGKERVMAFRHSGEFFGDMDLLDGQTDFATIIAMQPCKMLLITKPLFDEFFLKNVDALQGIIVMLCKRLREAWIFHAIIGMNNAESKIRATLARYGKTLGVQDSSGVIISKHISQQSLADRVLIARETVTRVMKKMKDAHEIEILAGRHIKLLPAFYEKLAQCELCMALPTHESGANSAV
jgi:CRP/FNR family transcriptional regulator, cyclic AMP receptor protein